MDDSLWRRVDKLDLGRLKPNTLVRVETAREGYWYFRWDATVGSLVFLGSAHGGHTCPVLELKVGGMLRWWYYERGGPLAGEVKSIELYQGEFKLHVVGPPGLEPDLTTILRAAFGNLPLTVAACQPTAVS